MNYPSHETILPVNVKVESETNYTKRSLIEYIQKSNNIELSTIESMLYSGVDVHVRDISGLDMSPFLSVVVKKLQKKIFIDIIDLLLKFGANPKDKQFESFSSPDTTGNINALVLYLTQGQNEVDVDVVKYLISIGVETHVKDLYGNNLLVQYCCKGNVSVEILDLLVSIGVNISDVNNKGECLLMVYLANMMYPMTHSIFNPSSSHSDFTDTVSRPPFNADSFHRTLPCYANYWSVYPVHSLLLCEPLNPKTISTNMEIEYVHPSFTPEACNCFSYLKEPLCTESTSTLSEFNRTTGDTQVYIDPIVMNQVPRFNFTRHEVIIRKLVDLGSNLNFVSSNEKTTPLLFAVMQHLPLSIIKLLVNLGCDTNPIHDSGLGLLGSYLNSYLYQCPSCHLAKQLQFDVVQYIVLLQGSLEVIDSAGVNVFMKYTLSPYCDSNIVEFLLDSGVHLPTSIDFPSSAEISLNHKESPQNSLLLHYLLNTPVSCYNSHLISLLIKNSEHSKYDIHHSVDDMSALLYAVGNNCSLSVFKTLIEGGSNVKYLGRDGKSLLMLFFENWSSVFTEKPLLSESHPIPLLGNVEICLSKVVCKEFKSLFCAKFGVLQYLELYYDLAGFLYILSIQETVLRRSAFIDTIISNGRNNSVLLDLQIGNYIKTTQDIQSAHHLLYEDLHTELRNARRLEDMSNLLEERYISLRLRKIQDDINDVIYSVMLPLVESVFMDIDISK